MVDRIPLREFIAPLFDGFAELDFTDSADDGDGPIDWDGYGLAHARARARTGETESVVCGTAGLDGVETAVIGFEFGFLGGSIGRRTGDRITAAHEHARRHGLPLLSLIATGGSRMQEGMRALSQLQRIVGQSILTRRAGLPQLAVLRDPATGGGWAVLGPSADVILALPGAQVGFAGSRVRPPGADPSAYTAESQLAHGHIDAIVPPEALRERLSRWLRLLADRPPAASATTSNGLGAAVPSVEPAPVPAALGRTVAPGSGWAAVTAARDPDRPRAASYLDAYFDWYEPISGDRAGGVDTGLLCGFGRREGRTIGYAAQTGTATSPAGFRTASRLIRTAGRLSIPVLTLIDTPGAANGSDAEHAGAAAAIADLFTAVAEATVPVTTLVIGEGGSGGAMALAAPGNTWATPDSYFAVIAPEAATSILKRPPEAVAEVAERLRLRPRDLLELGIIRGIVAGRG